MRELRTARVRLGNVGTVAKERAVLGPFAAVAEAKVNEGLICNTLAPSAFSFSTAAGSSSKRANSANSIEKFDGRAEFSCRRR
jgi:hypothetical protein